MDIVGGAVASLCEAYRDATRHDATGHWVNLLFDQQTDAIKVESPYTGDGLAVTLKRPGPLFVRIPAWADAAGVAVRGFPAPPRRTGRYLLLAKPPVGRRLSLTLDPPANELLLRHRTHDIRVRLRGDEVTAMDNFGPEADLFRPNPLTDGARLREATASASAGPQAIRTRQRKAPRLAGRPQPSA